MIPPESLDAAKRPDRDFTHRWHVAINQFMFHGPDPKWTRDFSQHRWMYDAKTAVDEVPRLRMLFEMERTGKLRQVHQQCSHSAPEPIPENVLTCCLGVKCRECPALQGLDKMEGAPEEIDTAKAWTCVAHILSKGGDVAGEGYILTTDDRMYWDRLHASLAMPNPDDEDEVNP